VLLDTGATAARLRLAVGRPNPALDREMPAPVILATGNDIFPVLTPKGRLIALAVTGAGVVAAIAVGFAVKLTAEVGVAVVAVTLSVEVALAVGTDITLRPWVVNFAGLSAQAALKNKNTPRTRRTAIFRSSPLPHEFSLALFLTLFIFIV